MAVFTTSLAFEDFAVSSKISDDLDKYGLGGHPLAIVKPVGWAALAAFGLSVALHLAFVRTAKQKAMGDYESLGESPPGDPTSRSASGKQHGNTPGRMKSERSQSTELTSHGRTSSRDLAEAPDDGSRQSSVSAA